MGLKSIEGARRKKKSVEQRLDEMRAALEEHAKWVSAQMEQMRQRVNALTQANNAVSVLAACVEEHLDETAAGWDGGKRTAIQERAELLNSRRDLIMRLQMPGISNEEREAFAETLFGLARRLDTEALDVPIVASVFVKTRNINRALQIVNYARQQDLQMSPEYTKLFSELEARALSLVPPPPAEDTSAMDAFERDVEADLDAQIKADRAETAE